MPPKPKTHKVEIEITEGAQRHVLSVFVKHGQTLLDAMKELERRGVVEMTYAKGFPYVVRVNGEAAGISTNQPLPWYDSYGIDSSSLNGKENMGYEFWVVDGNGRRNVPVAEYDGKKYFLTFGDIEITQSIKIGIGRNEGGIKEFGKDGEAILTHEQKDGIWVLVDILNRILQDSNAFLTPVEKIEYGWMVRDEILNPGAKKLWTERLFADVVEFRFWEPRRESQNKERAYEEIGDIPALLLYQKKLMRKRTELRMEGKNWNEIAGCVIGLGSFENGEKIGKAQIFEKSLHWAKDADSEFGDGASSFGGGSGKGDTRRFFSKRENAPEKTARENFAEWAGEGRVREIDAGLGISQADGKNLNGENMRNKKGKEVEGQRLKSKAHCIEESRTKVSETQMKEKAMRMKEDIDNEEKVRAIIFDLDGVLSDSEKAHYETFNQVFSKYGVKPIRMQYWLKNYTGRGSQFIIEDIISKNAIENADAKQIIMEREKLFARLIVKNEIKPVLGSLEVVRLARKRGLKIIVASGGHRKHVKAQLESIGLGGVKFLGMEDVKNRKPAPDVFLKAAKILGISAKNCLVIEDAASGLQAAKSAGMRCVLLGRHHAKSIRKKADLWLSKINASRIGRLLAPKRSKTGVGS